MEGVPADLPDPEVRVPVLDGWQGEARRREEGEVAWYGEVLERPLDPETRRVVQEILESEEHHARELAGKWMSA